MYSIKQKLRNMAHSVQISAVVMATLAAILLIVSLATNGWTKICTRNQVVLDVFIDSFVPKSRENIDWNKNKPGICFRIGLFTYRVEIVKAHVFSAEVLGDQTSSTTAALLIASLVFLALGIAMTSYNAFAKTKTELQKWKQACILAGGFAYFISVALCISGMGVYSTNQSLDSKLRLTTTFNDWNSNAKFNVQNVTKFLHSSSIFNSSRPGNLSEFKDHMLKFMTPEYDYSFGLGWAATALICLCALFMLHSIYEKLFVASNKSHTVTA